MGLHIFFIISGFLVTASFDSRRKATDFLKARAIRIFPGLVVCIALLVILGAFLTVLDPASYWSASETKKFFWKNSFLLGHRDKLPGVFETNKFGPAVNGSLWTLPIEARLYLLVALFGVFGVIAMRLAANLTLLALVAIGVFVPSYMLLIGSNINHLRLGVFFAVGAAMYVNRNAIPLRWSALAILLACSALAVGTSIFEILAGASIAYAVFLIGFARKIRLPKFIEDYSYGIYLYGWPVQQLIAHYAPHWQPYKMTLVAIPIAWILGALSWHLVEKKALRLKNVDITKSLKLVFERHMFRRKQG